MKVSLIITTFNRPEALSIVLKSALYQSIDPYEIIIADDGSNEKTKNLINDIRKMTKIPILHSWQEDIGNRTARSRNKAIAKSTADYIVIIDGDMLLDKHFIKDHLSSAKPNLFLQGSRVLIDSKLTKQILMDQDYRFNFFTKGLKNRINSLRLPFLAKFFSKEFNKLGGIRSCNMSFYKSDFLKVNGFNNDFDGGWGQEDSEFACRLMNAGLLRKNIKFSAIQFHLYHPEGSSPSKNHKLVEKALAEGLVFCKNGVNEYL